MRSRYDLLHHLTATYRLIGAFVVVTVLSNTLAQSQQPAEPSWRTGISTWNGNGYVAPSATQSVAPLPQPVPTAPTRQLTISNAPATSNAPYTIPVDPARLPEMPAVSYPGASPSTNPYFALPSPEELTALGLDSPNTGETAVPGLAIPPGVEILGPVASSSDVPPTGAPLNQGFVLPPEPVGAPAVDFVPLATQEPIDRLDLGADVLPPPAEIPLSEPALEEVASPDVEVDADADADAATNEAMVDKLGVDQVLEPGPLESEVIRWYQYPQRWMRGWDSHAEFGLDGSTGNARTLAIQTGLEMKRQTENHTLALDIDFRQASNRSVTTEENGRLNLDYDRLLHGTPWSGFGKFGMEWDKFKAFDLRLNMNGGLGYYWVRQEDANFVTRFGAGASREIGAPDDSWTPEAVFGGEAERQLTPRQKVKAKVDYFPAWEDFSNYRLVSDLAWEILLDGSDNLSLKLAATDRYDSTPQGAKKNDLYYSLLLLYKF